MRRSKTLAKLRAGRPVRSVALGGLLHPGYVRHAAHQGFDCIWLDLEHRAMDQREVQAMLAFFHLFDIDCMVRVPTLEKTRLYRYLEDGATGIMVPHVSTPEKAQMLVQALKFPPIGDRGLDGAGLDTDFIIQGGPTYTDEANRETFLTVQIETIEAVENVEKIAAIEGVDVLFVGPADLSLRIKHAKNLSWTFDDAINRVAAAAKKYGKNWGLPVGNPELVKHYYDLGARYINYGGDFGAAIVMLEKHSNELDHVFKEKRTPGQSAEPSADV
ncbi:MAG: HpcH/HpaI aldolase family protein [Planctomycetaceae bacterium]